MTSSVGLGRFLYRWYFLILFFKVAITSSSDTDIPGLTYKTGPGTSGSHPTWNSSHENSITFDEILEVQVRKKYSSFLANFYNFFALLWINCFSGSPLYQIRVVVYNPNFGGHISPAAIGSPERRRK
jgi:hypothetical protein